MHLRLLLPFALALVSATSASAAPASPPRITRPNVADRTNTQLLLTAQVNPRGRSTTARIEWGRTRSLGNATPVRVLGRMSQPVAVRERVTRLRANTVIYWRVVARSSGGSVMTSTLHAVTLKEVPAAAPPAPVQASESTVAPGPRSTAGDTLPSRAVFVAPNGSDSAGGTIDAPLQTVGQAIRNGSPGTAIVLRRGAYGVIRITRGGTAAQPLMLEAYPGERVVVDGAGSAYGISIPVSFVTVRDITVQGTSDAFSGAVVVSHASDVRLKNLVLQHNHAFGIELEAASQVSITSSLITHNGTGVNVEGAGGGVDISGNLIVDNDSMIVNDAKPDNDFGATGVILAHTSGATRITNNVISGNRATSHDYGHDGGGVELFGASRAYVAWNRIFDNDGVLETGTDGPQCSDNAFVHNVAYGGYGGMLLRCARRMTVAYNTFDAIGGPVFDVSFDSAFAASADGMRITSNIARQTDHPVYEFDAPRSMPIVLDRDIVSRRDGGVLANVQAHGSTPSVQVFWKWTGLEARAVRAFGVAAVSPP